MTKYWIAIASREHVQKGVEGSFAQVCHGKKSALGRMKKDDWIIYYSSKEFFTSSVLCQKFTAIGKVTDDTIYSFDMGEGFIPFRRNIAFYPCEEVSILPLIERLEFIQNKKHWGYPFRYGLVEIGENDFLAIKNNMLKK